MGHSRTISARRMSALRRVREKSDRQAPGVAEIYRRRAGARVADLRPDPKISRHEKRRVAEAPGAGGRSNVGAADSAAEPGCGADRSAGRQQGLDQKW